jgi:hypothetical protein
MPVSPAGLRCRADWLKSPNLEGYTTTMNVSQREGLGADGIMANDSLKMNEDLVSRAGLEPHPVCREKDFKAEHAICTQTPGHRKLLILDCSNCVELPRVASVWAYFRYARIRNPGAQRPCMAQLWRRHGSCGSRRCALTPPNAARAKKTLCRPRTGGRVWPHRSGLDSRQPNLGYLLTGWDFQSSITKSTLTCR